MKKKFTIIIMFLGIFIAVRILCKPADASIEGTVLEKNETTFMLETDNLNQIVCDWPKNYDTSQIEINDKITVYFNGEILETYPERIKGKIKIKKEKSWCRLIPAFLFVDKTSNLLFFDF